MPNVAAFVSFIFLTAFTPGANNIMALTNATKYGLRRGMFFCVGVFGGFLLVMSACALLCSTLFELLPTIEPAMRAVGALYLLFLAWTVLRDNGPSSTAKKPLLRPDSVLNGVLMQCVNVKVILYGITAFSTFILPYYKDIPAAGLFIVLLSAVGFAGTVSWAVFGSIFQKVFMARKTLINAVLALALVYCALSLVI